MKMTDGRRNHVRRRQLNLKLTRGQIECLKDVLYEITQIGSDNMDSGMARAIHEEVTRAEEERPQRK